MYGRSSHLMIVSVSMLFVALPSQAYLDPASGSMILQLILGGIAGLAIAVKVFWHKLLGIFGHKKREIAGSRLDGDEDHVGTVEERSSDDRLEP